MKRVLKIAGIVFGVAVLVLVISVVVAPPAEQPPVTQEPEAVVGEPPTSAEETPPPASEEPEAIVEEPPTSAEETPPPAESSPEESPPGPIDWSLVEITDVIKVPGTDSYMIWYDYPFSDDSFLGRFVSVEIDQYSAQLVRQLIEEDIALRLAEIEEEERMKEELGVA